MLIYVAQQLKYSKISPRNSSTTYYGYSSVFQMGPSTQKLEGRFCKWERAFTINKGYIKGKKSPHIP